MSRVFQILPDALPLFYRDTREHFSIFRKFPVGDKDSKVKIIEVFANAQKLYFYAESPNKRKKEIITFNYNGTHLNACKRICLLTQSSSYTRCIISFRRSKIRVSWSQFANIKKGLVTSKYINRRCLITPGGSIISLFSAMTKITSFRSIY